MDIVKKNLLSIICGVVALIAIVLVFFPIGGYFDSLSQKLQQSKETYNQLTGVLSKGRSVRMPLVRLDTDQSPALGKFPTETILEKASAVAVKMQQESDKLVNTASQYNTHKPLVPNALPSYSGTGLIDFREMYYRRFGQFLQDLHATAQPTDADVKAEKDRLLAAALARVGKQDGVADPQQQEIIQTNFEENVAPHVADQLKILRARNGVIYATENSFDHYSGIPPRGSAQRPGQDDIWVAQIAMWIQEDIVSALIATNAQATSVENAPVKRLVSISVDREYLTRTGKLPMTGQVGNAAPPPANPGGDDTTTATPRVFKYSPTGRVSNQEYDVVNFSVVVEADARHFRDFLVNLTNNRLITARDIQIIGVDRDKRQRQGFLYGKDPVVRVQLRCEAVFLHGWVLNYMPASIQKALGIAPAADASVANSGY